MVAPAMCLLVGVVLGLRFKVFALIPAIGVLFALVAIHGAIAGQEIWRIAGSTILLAALLQLGYLCGVFLRFVRVGKRNSPARRNQLPDGPTERHPPFHQMR